MGKKKAKQILEEKTPQQLMVEALVLAIPAGVSRVERPKLKGAGAYNRRREKTQLHLHCDD